MQPFSLFALINMLKYSKDSSKYEVTRKVACKLLQGMLFLIVVNIVYLIYAFIYLLLLAIA